MNYLEYIIYHNCDKGRIVVRHTQRFFTSYEEAKAIVGDQIALSPQCGFASVEEGNCIDEETQWKKIDLLVSCSDFL